MSRDPYQVLGVPAGASSEELHDAYRRLVKLHHPDHNGGSPESTRRFQEIQEAYDAVRSGNTRPRPAPPPRLALLALRGRQPFGHSPAAEATVDRGESSGGDARELAGGAKADRRDVDLRVVLVDRLNHGFGHVLDGLRADARRQLDARVGEHAGAADEAREDRGDADARAVQLVVQRGAEAAQAELRG